VTLTSDVDRAVLKTRAVRLQAAEQRMTAERARLALRWQRARARRQVSALDANLCALRRLVDELDEANPAPLEWTPVEDSLDDVLVPLN
jgi:hypothetical protein